MEWFWKTHTNGEQRGGMKAHAFESATRRSLCRKYDDGLAWEMRTKGSFESGPECAVCRKEVERLLKARCFAEGTH
jgi:hypothetical protein